MWEGELPAPLPRVEPSEEGTLPRERMHGRDHRLALVATYTSEDGEDDLVPGLEYEVHLDDKWGVGGLFDYFDGEEDHVFLAASLIYHPVREAGLSLSPGYQFVNGGSDRWALRTGMFYEFEIAEPWSIGPAIYTDFIEGGGRASIIGLSLNYNF